MEVQRHTQDAVTTLRLNGRFDSYGAKIFEEETSCLGENIKAVVLDFTDVSFLSSMGVRSVIKLEKLLIKKGGGIILVGLSPFIRKVLVTAGLTQQIKIADSMEDAHHLVQTLSRSEESAGGFLIEGRSFSFKRISERPVFLEYWGSSISSSKKAIDTQDLLHVDLCDLPLCIGIGGLGEDSMQAVEALAEFVSVGKVVGMIPADGRCLADFIVIQPDASQSIGILNALGIEGDPSFFLKQTDTSEVELADLLSDVMQVLPERETERPGLVGIVIVAQTTGLERAWFKDRDGIIHGRFEQERDDAAAGIVIVGVVGRVEPASLMDPEVKFLWEQMNRYPVRKDIYFHGHGIVLDHCLEPPGESSELAENLSVLLDVENLHNVGHMGPGTRLKDIKAWVYQAAGVRSGLERMVKIELREVTEFLPEWEIIVRRIYADSGRVVLSPIHGGFMSRTFCVESFDRSGRKQLPTVLKIGSNELTGREVEAHQRYVKNYILNNAASIMGTASTGKWAGLRYNFVGIGGPESRLSRLKDQYGIRPTEDLVLIFDRIFTNILKPWYGQPRWETIVPYVEHDPTRLFPNLIEDAERSLDISAEEKTFFCEELGLELPNPYHFLRHEYPRRKPRSFSWYSSIVHGDLNMQNILLDEKDNIYVIDFSETRERNIVEDFARMECVLRYEMIPMKNEKDLKDLCEFMAGLTESSKLSEIPPCRYRGSDPLVDKAYRLICRLRNYADRVTLFEENIEPYLIALLEWTYVVVSYISVGPLEKRLSALSAALVCRKLQEMESGVLMTVDTPA